MRYNTYLKIEEVLSLQELKLSSDEHDELLFTITHVMWFKQILHEFDELCSELEAGPLTKTDTSNATIFKNITGQIDILSSFVGNLLKNLNIAFDKLLAIFVGLWGIAITQSCTKKTH